MWHITTTMDTKCDGCGHLIGKGDLCISHLPEDLPKYVAREHFRHFHLACPQCEPEAGKESQSCYEVFASQLVTERAQQEVPCLNCGHSIIEGEPFFQDFFFIRDDGKNKVPHLEGKGPAALITAILKARQPKPTKFAQFSRSTIRRFSMGGLGNGRGVRNFAGAEEFYKSGVPFPVRNLGEEAVLKFTKAKDVSHIESVANSPSKALDPKNVIWESSKANLARGSRNMRPTERFAARATNTTDSFKIVGTAAARNAAKGAAWAALIEMPVSLVENSICVYRGKKDTQCAIRDTVRDTAIAGATGGVVTAGITAAGLAPAIVSAGPVLVPAGIVIFALLAGNRIFRAWKDGLTRVELSFHADSLKCEDEPGCYPTYAHWVSNYPTLEHAATQE